MGLEIDRKTKARLKRFSQWMQGKGVTITFHSNGHMEIDSGLQKQSTTIQPKKDALVEKGEET